jgi:uncharacterized membrane protein
VSTIFVNAQRMTVDSLMTVTVFCSVVVNQILYCFAAWVVFLDVNQIGGADAHLKTDVRSALTLLDRIIF